MNIDGSRSPCASLHFRHAYARRYAYLHLLPSFLSLINRLCSKRASCCCCLPASFTFLSACLALIDIAPCLTSSKQFLKTLTPKGSYTVFAHSGNVVKLFSQTFTRRKVFLDASYPTAIHLPVPPLPSPRSNSSTYFFMTAIQLLPSMPHAVTLDRPVNLFSARPDSRLPHPHLLHGAASSTSISSASQKPGLLYFTRNLTPPSEMNVGIDQGRLLPQTQSDGLGYGSRPQSQLHHHARQQSFNLHPNRHSASYSNVPKALSSPNTLRSTSTIQESKEQAKTSEANVAPSLRIPDTINTPQHGIPQLAAEVCVVSVPNFEVKRLISLDYLSLLV